MGHLLPPELPPRLNFDRRGLPRDYATYMWVVYKQHVEDDSPARRAFLNGTTRDESPLNFGQQIVVR